MGRFLLTRIAGAGFCAAICTALALGASTRASAADYQPGTAVSTAVAQVRPSVVAIETRFKEPLLDDDYAYWSYFRGARPLYGLWGTGFIYKDPQYVITTSFLMENAEYVRVILDDGRSYKAELVESDDDLDVAVLKVDWGPELEPIAPEFGDSASLKLGQPIAIVGKSLNSVDTYSSFGIISAIRKETPGSKKPTDPFLQVDASFELSFIGAPLIDVGGEVVGMVNTTVEDSALTNINLAVPVDDIVSIADRIISGTKKDVAVGMETQEMRPSLVELGFAPKEFDWDGDGKAEPMDYGMFLTYVEPSSPAEIAGMQAGDIVVQVDDKRLKFSYDYSAFKRSLSVGQLIKVAFIRKDASGLWKRMETQIQVLEAVEDEEADKQLEVKKPADRFAHR